MPFAINANANFCMCMFIMAVDGLVGLGLHPTPAPLPGVTLSSTVYRLHCSPGPHSYSESWGVTICTAEAKLCHSGVSVEHRAMLSSLLCTLTYKRQVGELYGAFSGCSMRQHRVIIRFSQLSELDDCHSVQHPFVPPDSTFKYNEFNKTACPRYSLILSSQILISCELTS